MSDLFALSPRRVLMKLFLPMAIGFLMLVLIDFADVVIAQLISVNALSILSYCFPIIYFMLAVGIGVNQGLTVSGAEAFAKKDSAKLHAYVLNAVVLSCIYGVLLISAVWFAVTYGAIDESFLPYLSQIKAFLAIMMLSVIPLFLLLVCCAWLQIQGRVAIIRDTLIIMLMSTVCLHPLFALSVGLGLGLNGIAISKLCVVLVGLSYVAYRLGQDRFCWAAIDLKCMKTLSKHMLAAIGIQALVPLYLYILNGFVADFGVYAVAGFVTGYRIAMLMVVPILAVLIALMVLISHYDSGQNRSKINETLRYAISRGSLLIFIALILTAVVGNTWMKLSGVLPDIRDIAVQYLIVAIILTVFEYIVGVAVVYLQAVQKPLFALGMALTKTLIFPVPFLFVATWWRQEISSIWFAIIAAFCLSGVISLLTLHHEGVLSKLEQ